MSILEDLKEWISDEQNFKVAVPIFGVIIFLILIMVVAIVVLSGGHNTPEVPTITPVPTIVNASTLTPLPLPAPSPTTAPVIVVKPQPWHGEDYDQYIRDLEAFYNKTDTPRENQTFPDPLAYKSYQLLNDYDNQTGGPISSAPGYVPGHPELSGGSIIYLPTPVPSPTPVPCPTPDPYTGEKHTPLNPVDASMVPPPDHTSTESGILAWDPGHSHGLYPYYYKGDVAAINLRFVNDQYKKPMTSEHVDLIVQKQVLGQYVQVIAKSMDYNYYVAPANVDQYNGTTDITNRPSFQTGVISIPIPSSFTFGGVPVDTRGQYIIVITVYVDNVQACKINYDTCIL